MSNSFLTPQTVACQATLPMGLPRQKSRSGLPFSSPGDLDDQGIEPASPALAGRFFTIEPPGKPREDIQIANKHKKRFSAQLIIREMQAKAIIKYYLTSVKMIIIRESIKMLDRMQRKANSLTLLVGIYSVTATMESGMKFL